MIADLAVAVPILIGALVVVGGFVKGVIDVRSRKDEGWILVTSCGAVILIMVCAMGLANGGMS